MTRVALMTGGLPFGGTTTFTLYLACGLRDLGVQVEVFSFTSANPFGGEFETAGIPVHRQNEKRFIFEDRVEKIYAELIRFNPTVVVAVIGTETFDFLRYAPPRVLRVGIFHDRGMMIDFILKCYPDVLDHLVVVAPYLIDEVQKGNSGVPFSYLLHGIPIPPGIPARAANPDRPLRLIYYGRLVHNPKRVRIFPEIVGALHKRNIPFQWTIHGSGPDEAFLRESLQAEIKSGEVIISTPMPGTELVPMIREHDVYMLASFEEGGPFTLLESMALGLVPICAELPCLVQEVITPENGFRVEGGDVDAYADAIATLHGDRPLLEKMSAAAHAVITANFTHTAMAKRYLDLFKSLQPGAVEIEWPKKINPMPMRGWNSPLASSAAGKIARRLWKLKNCAAPK